MPNRIRQTADNRVLDATDRQIVRALQKNARLSNKELAARTGIAPSTCVVRLRRLITSGILVGFHAVANPQAMGVGLEAIVAVTLSPHSAKNVQSFRSHAINLEEVVQLFHMAGASDFLVHVAVRNSEHLRDLAMTSFTARPEVLRIETSVLFEQVAGLHCPIFGVN